MIDQYDSYVINNRSVNGKLTLGENLADLGGVILSYRAMCDQYKSSDRNLTISDKQDFFINFANLWKRIIRPEKLTSMLLSNPHSPDKYRVFILRNVDEFYHAFNDDKNKNKIYDNNSMYLDPVDRVMIW